MTSKISIKATTVKIEFLFSKNSDNKRRKLLAENRYLTTSCNYFLRPYDMKTSSITVNLTIHVLHKIWRLILVNRRIDWSSLTGINREVGIIITLVRIPSMKTEQILVVLRILLTQLANILTLKIEYMHSITEVV